jgi:DNA invertase Pin-like site-specific DNA recombinase
MTTMGKKLGYGRVSTAEQSTEIQKNALLAAGAEKLFLENFTGTKANRPELDRLRDQMRSGDTVLVTKLDRLARSTKDLLNLVSEFHDAGVELVVLEQNINTSTSEGKFLLNVLSAVAELERDMIVARTQQGLAAAKARGRVGGRKAKMSPEQMAEVRNFYEKGKSVTDISALFSVSRASVYRVLDKTTSEAGEAF